MLLALLTACLAIPVVTPPARLSLVGGPSFETVPQPVRPEETLPLTGELRLGVQPLGMFPTLQDRMFDVTGGMLVHLDHGDERLGATLEGSVYLWQEQWNPQSRARLRAFGALDALGPEARSPGWYPGARAGVGLDWGGFVPGAPSFDIGTDGSWVGVAYGEWAIGLVAEGGYQQLPETDLIQIALGVEVQMPATAGFLLVPIR